jgi:DNA-binding NarL/FixJ family response regulator
MLTRRIRVSVTGPLADVVALALERHSPGVADWLEVVDAEADEPDVVVTLVVPGEAASAIAAARDAAAATPILALIPRRDEVQGQVVMACGASGWLGLNEPPEMLRIMIAAAAARQTWPDRCCC